MKEQVGKGTFYLQKENSTEGSNVSIICLNLFEDFKGSLDGILNFNVEMLLDISHSKI